MSFFLYLYFFSIPSIAAETIYGEAKFQSPVVLLETLVTDSAKFQGQNVTTEGLVMEVCSRAGCWLNLKDGKAEVRVLMIDHGFAVPKKLKGQRVQVEGTIEEKEFSPELIQHYLKDAGKSQKEIAKVTKAKTMFQFIAIGVKPL